MVTGDWHEDFKGLQGAGDPRIRLIILSIALPLSPPPTLFIHTCDHDHIKLACPPITKCSAASYCIRQVGRAKLGGHILAMLKLNV